MSSWMTTTATTALFVAATYCSLPVASAYTASFAIRHPRAWNPNCVTSLTSPSSTTTSTHWTNILSLASLPSSGDYSASSNQASALGTKRGYLECADNEDLDDEALLQGLDQALFEHQAMEQRLRLEHLLYSTVNDENESYYIEHQQKSPRDNDKTDVAAFITTPPNAVREVAAASSTDETASAFPFQGLLSEIWKARLLLLGAAALYGTNFSLVKLLGDTMPVEVSGTLRFGMASLATLPWLLRPPREHQPTSSSSSHHTDISISKPKPGNWWDNIVTLVSGTGTIQQQAALGAALAGFEVGMWNSVGYVAQAVGLETTAASKSAFLCSLAVVIVPILDLFVGKRMLPKQIVGALLAVAGVGFLELGGGAEGGIGNVLSSLSYGDVASLIQPLAFGLGFWRMENAMSLYPQHADRSTAAQMLAVFAAYAGYCAISCGLTHTVHLEVSQLVAWLTNPSILGSLFWTGCVTTALTVYMETLALKTLSAAETTLIFSTEPLWGTAFAAYVMGEHLGWDAAMGAILILSGCIFSNLGFAGILAKLPTPSKDSEKAGSPHSFLINVGIAGAMGAWVASLQQGWTNLVGETEQVMDVTTATTVVEELEKLEDVLISVNEIVDTL